MLSYLDNAATTKPHPHVIEAMNQCMEQEYGNASSLHRMGLTAEHRLQEGRSSMAGLIHAQKQEIIFTSGGTESDYTAIYGTAIARKREGQQIITTSIEHPAVLETCKRLEQQGFQVIYLKVDPAGRIDLTELEQQLSDRTILVSVMHVNNELGTIQPLSEIGALIQSKSKASFHTDAVQSFGKLPLDVRSMGIDLLSASSHKLYGPKGVGLLYRRERHRLEATLVGGGQEGGLRSGTENVPGIAGFAKAVILAQERMDRDLHWVQECRSYLWKGIQTEIPDAVCHGPQDLKQVSPYLLNVSFPGTKGEVLLHMLEQNGIYVSTGSACSSRKRGQSHVLTAIGLPKALIEGAIRFSFHNAHTMEELDQVIHHVKKSVLEMRKIMFTRSLTGRKGENSDRGSSGMDRPMRGSCAEGDQ